MTSHCFMCNVALNAREESHNIFSKLDDNGNVSNKSAFQKIGHILRRSLGSINIHSDFVCLNCFASLSEYDKTEKKLEHLRSEIVGKLNDTARLHEQKEEKTGGFCNLSSSQTQYEELNQSQDIEKGKFIAFVRDEKSNENNTRDRSELESLSNAPRRKKSATKPLHKAYSCPVCMKLFRAYSHRVEHMLIHLGEKPWSCEECQKTFRTKSALKVHSSKHTGQCKYSCSTCGKGFTSSCYLEEHKRIHSGEKPFICNTCGKSFICKKGLVIHTKVHTNDTPFLCDKCPKKFAVKSRLERHTLIHSQEKPFMCEVCTKGFSRSDDLKVHMRLHTGERPFQCSFCNKKFTNHSNRLAHVRTHTGAKIYHCSRCSKAFSRKLKLEAHIAQNHSGTADLPREAVTESPITDMESLTPSQIPAVSSDTKCISEGEILKGDFLNQVISESWQDIQSAGNALSVCTVPSFSLVSICTFDNSNGDPM